MEKEIDKPDGYWSYPIADDFVLAPLTAKEVEDVTLASLDKSYLLRCEMLLSAKS